MATRSPLASPSPSSALASRQARAFQSLKLIDRSRSRAPVRSGDIRAWAASIWPKFKRSFIVVPPSSLHVRSMDHRSSPIENHGTAAITIVPIRSASV